VIGILGRVAAAFAVAVWLIVGATAVNIWWTARQDERPVSDAIVVLGSAQYDGKPSPIFEARLDHALDLYNQGVAPMIITVGGRQEGDRFTEAEAGLLWLVDEGIPEEALRAVPSSLRHASLALGATRWETTWHHVLPAALPGILTGTILALSRAIGEAAPIILISSIAFIAFLPDGLLDSFTVLPIQIYIWVSKPQEDFHAIAASAIIVLLVLLLTLNAIAIFVRDRSRRSAQW